MNKKLQLVIELAAWIDLYELQGKIGRKMFDFPQELYDLILEAQQVEWDLKVSLHRIVNKIKKGCDYSTLKKELRIIGEKYQ